MPVKKKQLVIGGFLLMAVIAGLWWNLNSAKIVLAAKGLLLNQVNQLMNGGRIETGDIELSLLGKVVINKVAVYDQKNVVVVSCDKISVGYSLGDILKGNLGLGAVQTVTLNAPKLSVNEAPNGSYNLEELLKPQPEKKLDFRGQVVITDGVLNYSSPEGSRQVDKIAGTIDFSGYPLLQCRELIAYLSGQKIEAAGQLDNSGQDVKIKLNFSSASFDPTAVSPDIPIHGVVSFKGETDGTLGNPLAKGTLEMPQGQFATIPFANAVGAFHYANSIVAIDSLQADVYGGVINLTGTLVPKTLAYDFHIVGNGMDANQVSENKVQAKASFTCDADGVGNWDSATAQGNFSMGSGTINGIAFNSMSGDFRKQGTAVSVYGVLITTAYGQLKADGSVDGNIVKFNVLPVIPADAVEKAVQRAIPGLPTSPANNLRKLFP